MENEVLNQESILVWIYRPTMYNTQSKMEMCQCWCANGRLQRKLCAHKSRDYGDPYFSIARAALNGSNE